jgi:hypothetical protein
MKNVSLFSSSFFLLLIVMLSCKKNVDIEPTPNPPIVLSPDSNYLSKIFIIQKTGNIIDTSTYMFTYDNLKRVRKKTDLTVNVGPGSTFFDSTIYTYNSSDLLPNKITQLSGFGSDKDTIAKFLTYNTSGMLLRDSALLSFRSGTFYQVIKEISNYTKVGSKIYGNTVSTMIYNSSGNVSSIYTKKDTLTLDANSNLVGHNYSFSYVGNPTLIDRNVDVYSYGTNPSPFTNMNISKSTLLVEDIVTPNASKNNMLTLNQKRYENGILQNNQVEDYTGKYSFKTNGYPAFLTFIDPTVSSDFVKVVYVYTTL